MAEGLDGTAALVTGASSGIGQAAALKLAHEGAAVALVARRRDRLEVLAAAITSAGGKALVIEADITDSAQATAAVETTVRALGRLDTVINAAGLMINGPTQSSPLDDWDAMVDINLKGLMYITKAALPHLLDAVASSPRKVADVVNISSVAGRRAAPLVAIYAATKFGVTAATEAWRQEFTKQGVRFSVIEPGATETELFGHHLPEMADYYDKMFANVEKLHAEDIANAVAYIVTNPRRISVNEIVLRSTDQV